MKVIQVPFCFAPDPVGGTEVFVAQLTRDLQAFGVDVTVAAPSDTNSTYSVDGIKVRRFAATHRIRDVAELYGEGDVLAAIEFTKILSEQQPDIVHLHAFTAAVSLRIVRATNERGIPVVFTYHTPTASCVRGTLLLWGNGPCNGTLDTGLCTACSLHGLGLPRWSAALVGRAPPEFGEWLGAPRRQGSVWTALRMRELVRMRHSSFRQMVSEVSHIVAVCDWVRALLLRNNVPPEKVSMSRQGIEWTLGKNAAAAFPSIRDESTRVRLAFVGRLDRTKGLHVLVEALRMIPTANVCLDVYGVIQNGNTKHLDEIQTYAGSDERIVFQDALRSDGVVARLQHYDFLAVPSQWMETGPMVVLEAFAAGVPVIGGRLGGISEIVRDGIDGILIDPASATEWARTLRRITMDAGLRARLKAGVRPPRASIDVAGDMIALYESIRNSRRDTN